MLAKLFGKNKDRNITNYFERWNYKFSISIFTTMTTVKTAVKK